MLALPMLRIDEGGWRLFQVKKRWLLAWLISLLDLLILLFCHLKWPSMDVCLEVCRQQEQRQFIKSTCQPLIGLQPSLPCTNTPSKKMKSTTEAKMTKLFKELKISFNSGKLKRDKM
jgi:hypothetical protein